MLSAFEEMPTPKDVLLIYSIIYQDFLKFKFCREGLVFSLQSYNFPLIIATFCSLFYLIVNSASMKYFNVCVKITKTFPGK